MKLVRAYLHFYLSRPVMNWLHRRGVLGDVVRCPGCGGLLDYYESHGFLHIGDGDADCDGLLGKGKA